MEIEKYEKDRPVIVEVCIAVTLIVGFIAFVLYFWV